MKFDKVDRTEYEHNVLFEVIFQAKFPDIMKIASEEPVKFQDIIRKEGYPETGTNNFNFPIDMPENFKKILSVDKEYYFYSEDENWQVSLTKSFIALSCKGKGSYINYSDFKAKLKKILEIFNDVYEPTYFSRIGLRYRNIINDEFIPLGTCDVKDCIPEYVFPESKQPLSEDIKAVEKISQFDDGNMKANVTHTYGQISGKFGHQQISNKWSYFIDIDCFSDNRIRDITSILDNCDSLKENEWNIFQWSITKDLRMIMKAKE